MGTIVINNYPILIELRHNDSIQKVYQDEWGSVDVFRIDQVYYLNRTSLSLAVSIIDETGKTWNTVIQPGANGTINLPTPLRFDSFPLSFNLTYSVI